MRSKVLKLNDVIYALCLPTTARNTILFIQKFSVRVIYSNSFHKSLYSLKF